MVETPPVVADDWAPPPPREPTPLRAVAPPAPFPTLDATALAEIVVLMAQAGAVAGLGPHAQFTPDERERITAAVARLLNRLPLSAAEQLGPMADVLLLAGALAPWLIRVVMVRQLPAQTAAVMARAAAHPQSPTVDPPAPVVSPPDVSPEAAPGPAGGPTPEPGDPTVPPTPPPAIAALFAALE